MTTKIPDLIVEKINEYRTKTIMLVLYCGYTQFEHSGVEYISKKFGIKDVTFIKYPLRDITRIDLIGTFIRQNIEHFHQHLRRMSNSDWLSNEIYKIYKKKSQNSDLTQLLRDFTYDGPYQYDVFSSKHFIDRFVQLSNHEIVNLICNTYVAHASDSYDGGISNMNFYDCSITELTPQLFKYIK